MSVEVSSWPLPGAWSEEEGRDRNLLYGIAFWLALIQVSIAASQIVLSVLLCTWAYRLVKGELALASLPVDRPFLVYAGLSLLAAVFSFDPAASLQASKKLLLLLVPYLLVSAVRRKASVEALVLVLILMADVGALVGLWQYHFSELGDLDHRIRGFMGHYMTYSGLLMGVGVMAVALLLFRGKYRGFLIGSLGVICAALVLTLTRSAWIGMLAVTVMLAFLRDRRLLLLVPPAIIAAALLMPRAVESRMGSFVRPDTSGWDRIYMLEAGSHMIANHPWLGVGTNMVAETYPVYIGQDAPRRENLHLHNNLVQIAAERGVPCLLAWLWLVAIAFFASVRSFKHSAADPQSRALAAGAMGVIVAAFLAGLFEYNFGDSEFQMLFLFVMSIPWILQREQSAGAPPHR